MSSSKKTGFIFLKAATYLYSHLCPRIIVCPQRSVEKWTLSL